MTTDANDTTIRATDGAKKPATPRKAAPKKAKEFAPIVKENGKLDHTNCGHDRTPKGRAACRAEAAKK